MQTQVMRKMWELLRNGITSSKSEALKAAWIICKIKAGWNVEFRYTKADGSMREAVSTGYIPEPATPKGTRQSPVHICTYFDMTVSQWRSFDIRRLAV